MLLEDGTLVDGLVVSAEFGRSTIAETRMRPYIIVVAAPDFDEHAGFLAAAKPFHAQALVTKLAVETLVVGVLPRFSRIDQRGFDALFGEPAQDRVTDEFRTVIGARQHRGAALADQTREHFNDPAGADPTGH